MVIRYIEEYEPYTSVPKLIRKVPVEVSDEEVDKEIEAQALKELIKERADEIRKRK